MIIFLDWKYMDQVINNNWEYIIDKVYNYINSKSMAVGEESSQ